MIGTTEKWGRGTGCKGGAGGRGLAMWCQVAEDDRSDNAYDLRFKRDFCIPCAYTVPWSFETENN